MITLLTLPTTDHPTLITIPAPEAACITFIHALPILLENAFPVAERTFCQPREPGLSDLVRLSETFP